MDLQDPVPATPENCPKYLRLARNFERQLRTGVLRIGDRLPSVRQLRQAHQVSAATAVGCYVWLERQGYIRARPKSGFYVTRTPGPEGPTPAVAGRSKGPVMVRTGHYAVAPSAGVPAMLELGPAVVSPTLLPMARLNRSVRLALSAFADSAIRYEDPGGNLRLRRQLARLLFRQGATCAAEDIVITSGSTEALSLSIRAVTKPGDVVAVESPGCYDILQALESLHLRAIEIPHVVGSGIDRQWLSDALQRHRLAAVILNATCHNPLGDCVDDESKADLVRFATTRNLPLIESDTFGELVFSGVRPKSLKAFDTTGIVLQCASLAHYVAPGFNIGYAHAGRWRDAVERLKSFTNVAHARLPQLAMAEFLESGAYEKHLKALRLRLWQAVEATRDEVLRTFPSGTRVSRPDGGFVLWVQLPNGYDGADVHRRARSAGINILPGSVFSPTNHYRRCIRIACGHPPDVLVPAIRTIATLL